MHLTFLRCSARQHVPLRSIGTGLNAVPSEYRQAQRKRGFFFQAHKMASVCRNTQFFEMIDAAFFLRQKCVCNAALRPPPLDRVGQAP